MERIWLTREKANTYWRMKSLAGCPRRTPILAKEISRKKSSEGRTGSPLPIRQGQPSEELRAHSKLPNGNPYGNT